MKFILTLIIVLVGVYSSKNIFSADQNRFTVFKNKLFTKVDAQTNGLHRENHCIKRPSHL